MKKTSHIPKGKKESSIPPIDKGDDGKLKIKKINLDEINHAPGYDSSRARKRTPLPPSGRKDNPIESPVMRKQSFRESCTNSIEKEQKPPITERNLSSSQLPMFETPLITLNNASSTCQNQVQTSGNIKVVCRFRPLNEKEKVISQNLCVEFIDSQNCSIKTQTENNPFKFGFDKIFDFNSTQQEVYEYSARSIIESVLEGFNGTVFAYGQTSSGKTYTMTGVMDNPEKEGIIPRMIHQVFEYIINSSSEIEYTVKVSMIEIYMEKIRDLIDCTKTNLNVREDKDKGIYIEDLTEHYVVSEEEVINLMKSGNENRSVGATNMNEHSSRSHSTVIITIHQNNTKDLSAKIGKLYLVDLAGSEKISKTGASGMTLEEAKTINKSLTSLGMVINALTDGKSTHIPYRESKLTRVLQESLGGNAKTALIITASPSSYNDAETLSTLRFGLRAKKIKNKPKINKDVTAAELKIEIEKLQAIILTGQKKIDRLETFIIRNGLKVPLDEEVDKTLSEIKLNFVDANIENSNEIKAFSIDIKNSKEVNSDNLDNFKFNQLKEKYDKAEIELNELLEEKAHISKRLLETLELMNQINVTIEEKNNSDEQIKQIKFIYEDTIELLKIQIRDMEGIINNKNKRSLFIVKDDLPSFEITPKRNKRKFENLSLCSISTLSIGEDSQNSFTNIDYEESHLNRYQHLLIEKHEKISNSEIGLINEKNSMIEKDEDKEERMMLMKIQSLEKNSEQKNLLYQKMVTEKSKLKIDNQFLVKKLKKKDEKIQSLEKLLEETNEQLKTLNEKVSQLQSVYSSKLNYSTNVVKVIKGGIRSTSKMNGDLNFNTEHGNAIIDSQDISETKN